MHACMYVIINLSCVCVCVRVCVCGWAGMGWLAGLAEQKKHTKPDLQYTQKVRQTDRQTDSNNINNVERTGSLLPCFSWNEYIKREKKRRWGSKGGEWILSTSLSRLRLRLRLRQAKLAGKFAKEKKKNTRR